MKDPGGQDRQEDAPETRFRLPSALVLVGLIIFSQITKPGWTWFRESRSSMTDKSGRILSCSKPKQTYNFFGSTNFQLQENMPAAPFLSNSLVFQRYDGSVVSIAHGQYYRLYVPLGPHRRQFGFEIQFFVWHKLGVNLCIPEMFEYDPNGQTVHRTAPESIQDLIQRVHSSWSL